MFGCANVQNQGRVSEALKESAGQQRSGGWVELQGPGGEVCGNARSQSASHGVVVLLDGCPHWDDSNSSVATSESVARAYLERGHHFLEHLNGGFALAVSDPREGRLVLAIDRMGIGALSWARSGDVIVFSTSVAAVANAPGVDAHIPPQGLFDFFFFHMVPSPLTIYSNVTKICPATATIFTTEGRDELCYWSPSRVARSPNRSFHRLKAELHEALANAVRTRVGDGPTGAFLSGGLDSSTVAGYLGRVTGRPAPTFSMGFAAEGFDELSYARITNAHFGCHGHEVCVTPDDILSTIPLVAETYDEPFGNSSAVPTYLCARQAAESGMSRLLAGDAGDELFAGNERYARQRVFEVFGRMPRSVQRLARRLVQDTVAVDHNLPPLRKLRSYIDQASIPLPERYETWNFVYREGAALVFEEDFMRDVDTRAPFRYMDEVFHANGSGDLLDHMLFYDWKFTLADNDLRKVATMCHAAGLEVEFPFLDNRIVELSVRVPSTLKMRGLSLRSFYKRAMRGFLPEEVLRKPKHGFGLPFGLWLKTHAPLSEFVYESLRDLGRRGFVRRAFIEQLIGEHRDADAGYYGYLMWDLMMLEEWLKRRRASADRIGHRTLPAE